MSMRLRRLLAATYLLLAVPAAASELSFPGATSCLCTGNDGASDGSNYASNIGSECAAWDSIAPATYCLEGGTSYGADWCDDAWCYVDPNACDQPYYSSSYFPDVELSFSYKVLLLRPTPCVAPPSFPLTAANAS